ncbi:carbon storage regulator CsrA [Desulforamulus ruminis]|uniref:Translational regulator CsrA n=1 Tax=Desulforamulus ruminis (strain ATCC 23193 / DSM 2154 / NCIMB 8452 / DL) TaxID=696281 RepID=F6DNQ6_DESRL|nr:carbon storage regulator CsrA [Desulforamulus ruminis]AEG59501.1 carbon storage regulator [Desulforamulus ruminis DSM 2154]
MLVLSRKKNESIQIAGSIKITILDITGDNIKLGIEAPRSIEIYRSEVLQSIRQENEQSVLNSVKPEELVKLLNEHTKNHRA